MYDLWRSCSPSHPCSTTLWAPDHSMIMRLRKDKRHWWAPAKARSCPGQGGIEPLHMLTTLGLKSSPNPSWNDRRPVAGEGVLANMRRCKRGGNSYRSVVGFHGKWLPSRGWLPRARALASVLWRGVRYRGRKGRRPKIPTAARQMASFKGRGAQRTCPGLCPVAWGAI